MNLIIGFFCHFISFDPRAIGILHVFLFTELLVEETRVWLKACLAGGLAMGAGASKKKHMLEEGLASVYVKAEAQVTG